MSKKQSTAKAVVDADTGEILAEKQTLWSMSADIARIAGLLEVLEEEASGSNVEDADACRDALKALLSDLDQKADSVASYLLELEAIAEAISAESDRLRKRAAKIRRRRETLISYTMSAMRHAGVREIGRIRSLRIRRNGGSPAMSTVGGQPLAEFEKAHQDWLGTMAPDLDGIVLVDTVYRIDRMALRRALTDEESPLHEQAKAHFRVAADNGERLDVE